MRLRLLLLALLAACGPSKAVTGETGTPGGGGGGDDTAAGGDDTATGGDDTAAADTGLPPDPSPFNLTVTGPGTNLTLTFDEPDCTQPKGSANFSQFWRNAEGQHVFVLAFQLLGTFRGAGDYSSSADGARVKLQEEAGGELRYFYSGTGDEVSATIEHIDDSVAWGEFSFTGLHDGDGNAVSVSPMPVPIWCPEIE